MNTDELWLLKLASETPSGAAYRVDGDPEEVARAYRAAQSLERRGLVHSMVHRPNGRSSSTPNSVLAQITDDGRTALKSAE